MAARLLGAPISLVSLVTDDRAFFKSATGLPEPWASRRTTPLAYSFCRHVVGSGDKLVVEDARRHPLLRTSPAVRELGWISYAGVPLTTRRGEVVGALSVIDGMPRLWSERDVALLEDLAACVVTEIELRSPPNPRLEEPGRNGGWQLQGAFEDLGIAMAVAAPDGRWLRVNRALCDLLGYGPDELIGRPAEALTHPDDRSADQEATRLLLAGECTSYTAEKRLLRRSGDALWVLASVTVVYGAEGRPHHFLTGIQDVSDRKRTESALRESEESKLLTAGQSRLLEEIASGIELQRILDRIVGFAEDHGNGMVGSLMLLDQDRQQLRAASGSGLPPDYWKAIQRVPVGPTVGSCGTAAYRRELVIVRDIATDPLWDGFREVALAAGLRACWSSPILASDGTVLGTFAMYYREPREPGPAELRTVEIATHLAGIAIERERNLDALQRSTRLLQQVLDTLPVGVWVLDGAGQIIFANPASNQIWGGVRYVGMDRFGEYRAWWAETGEPIPAEGWAAARAIRAGVTSLNEVVQIEAFDGAAKTILNSAAPIKGVGGEILGAIVLHQDITQRRAAAEALRRSEDQLQHARKMEAVGQLAGGIAHDYNNLLTGILSYSDLILAELRQGDPIRADIEQIRQIGQRAAALTRQFLAFSRRQVLQPAVLSLNATVADLNTMLRRLLGADVSLEINLDPGLWHVMADPGQLEQVLVNLVVNARDAMPRGGRVTIATANWELEAGTAPRANGVRPGEYVTLTVGDTGVGMDVPTQARIFEPFFTTKELGKGTGLGLSTVYGIVDQSGGHVTVESAPGQGATFTIFLPRHAGPDSAAPARDRRGLPGGNETLLLVEDEAAVRTSARRLLERHGYTVLEARHGGDALRLAEESGRTVDLVLTDLVMPEMGGRELAERLRAHQPGLKVLFMSGYTEKALTPDGIMPPHTGLVEKPFTVEQLMRRLREVLDE